MLRSRFPASVALAIVVAGTGGTSVAHADWSNAPAQIRFRRLSVEEGLSVSTVRTILQDHKGFLWVGTQGGLNMYDGFTVTVLKHEPDNDNSLPGSHVTSLAESRTPSGGILWVGTFRGLAAIHTATGRVERFQHRPGASDSLNSDAIETLLLARDGALWIGTRGGLHRMDVATRRMTRIPLGPPVSPSSAYPYVTSIAEDPNGHIWVGTSEALVRLDPSGTLRKFSHDPKNGTSVNHAYIRALLVDRAGRLWVGTDRGGLDRFDASTETFVHHVHGGPETITSNAVNALLQDGNGDIWVGLWGGGLNRLIERGGQVRFESFRHNPVDPYSLSVDDVTALAQDRSGVIWIGTYAGGLSSFAPAHGRRFPHYTSIPTDPKTLTDNRVHALLVDRARTLWVGTWNGISRLRSGDRAFTRLRHDPADPDSLSDNRVNELAEAPDGAIWVATMDGGLNRIDPATGLVRRYRTGKTAGPPPPADRVMSVHVDTSGVVWKGTLFDGLHRISPDGTTAVFKPDPAQTSTGANRINRIVETADGELWIATNQGLCLFDRQTQTFTRLHEIPGAAQALMRPIVDIVESGGAMWAGTSEAGLLRIVLTPDRKSVSVRTFRQRDGLADDRIYRVLPDEHSRLWITTDNGMTMMDPATGAMRRFDAAQGLQSNQFLAGGFFDDTSGTMFVGGIRGFNRFTPSAMGPEAPVVPVVLTDFLLRNEPVRVGELGLEHRIADAREVRLPHASLMFSLEFAALDLAAPEKTAYMYMLEGFDQQWNHTTANRRFVTYTSLSPGRYLFKVRGANRDGVWNPEPISLTVIVEPPFWMTWWFRALAIITGALMVAFAVRARVASLERQRRRLEHEVETRTAELLQEKQKVTVALEQAELANAAKTTFLANVSHEIRTPLAAVVGLADVLGDTRLDPQQREYVRALTASGEALSELVDDTLDLRKIELDRLELESIPFNLRRLVSDSLEVIRLRALQKGLALECTIDQGVPHDVQGDPRALRRVLLNLLANAVKFTDRGRVSLTVTTRAGSGQLQFVVLDTGIGIPEAKHALIFDTFVQAETSTARLYGGSGLGLALCRELVRLMGGRIWVESAPGEGSRFHFTLPIRAAQGTTEPAAVQRMDATVHAQRLRILAVEDAPQNRLLLSAYLKDEQYHVDFAETGEAGVERFRESHYDIVLMDVNLPGIDGYAAASEIRRIERLGGRPPAVVIALTAYAFAEDEARSRAAGCDEHLTKPVRKAVLLEALHRRRGASAV